MYFSIRNKQNKPIFSGKVVLFTPHTATSETQKTLCYLVYLHDVEILHQEEFDLWALQYLVRHKATGCGGKEATSPYNYIEFKQHPLRGDYDFMITNRD